MGFKRALVSDDSKMSQPLRAGDGYLANCSPKNYNTQSDETVLISELSGGKLLQGLTLTSDVTYTLPTVAIIAAEWPSMDVGDSFEFYVGNNQAAAFDVIIAVGAGMTAIGTNNNLSVAPQSSKLFTLTKRSATAYDLY